MEPEQTLSSRRVYDGRLIKVRVDEVRLPNGRTSSREIVEHPGAAAIVALTPERQLVLVRQYRKAVESLTLEIPAGTLAAGEDPLSCAIRELREETGYVAQTVREVCSFYSAIGFCTELMHLFVADGLQSGPQAFEDDEAIEVVELPLAAVSQMIQNGTVIDAKTVAGVFWAQLFLSGHPLVEGLRRR